MRTLSNNIAHPLKQSSLVKLTVPNSAGVFDDQTTVLNSGFTMTVIVSGAGSAGRVTHFYYVY